MKIKMVWDKTKTVEAGIVNTFSYKNRLWATVRYINDEPCRGNNSPYKIIDYLTGTMAEKGRKSDTAYWLFVEKINQYTEEQIAEHISKYPVINEYPEKTKTNKEKARPGIREEEIGEIAGKTKLMIPQSWMIGKNCTPVFNQFGTDISQREDYKYLTEKCRWIMKYYYETDEQTEAGELSRKTILKCIGNDPFSNAGNQYKKNELAGFEITVNAIVCNEYPDDPRILANYVDKAAPKQFDTERRKTPQNIRAAYQWAKEENKCRAFIDDWLWVFSYAVANILPNYGAKWSPKRKAWYIKQTGEQNVAIVEN